MLLTEADVIDLVDIPEAIRATEAMYLKNAGENVRYHNPVRVKVPAGSLRITAGALLGDGVMGARIGSASGLRGDSTVQLLFDAVSGDLLCLLSYPLSLHRTAANMGLAVKWLTADKPVTVAMTGTGRNALGLLAGVAAVRPISALRVFSRREQAREQLAEDAAEYLSLSDSRPAPSSDEAVAGADVVICSTNSYDPVFNPDALADDVFVGSMGSPAEVPEQTLLRATGIFVGSRAQEEQYHHYHSYREDVPPRVLVQLALAGRLAWGRTVHELADVIRGSVRPVTSGITVFKESQGGASDLALGLAAYRKAVELGRGQQVDLAVRAQSIFSS